ncbi:MAG TPA: hypothetical protein VHE12_12920 [bacterium]|nr:hypothetical protein [bacterium]
MRATAAFLLWSLASMGMAAPVFLDLSKAANFGPNQSLYGNTHGVEDPREKEGFANIPQGPQTFRGIPFQLLDWTQNQGRSYIALKGRPKKDLPEAVAIPAGGATADSLYFLHTCRWGGTDTRTTIAEYEVIYADGQVALIPLHVGAETTNFTGADDTPESSLAWWHKYKNTDMGLSLYHWKNPRPNAPIETLVFHSLGRMPVPILFAVTLSDKEWPISPVSPKPEKTFQTDTKDWNPYTPPTSPVMGTALDMSSLLEAPAGKHGKLKADGDRLAFEDGTLARFWGTKLSPSWTTRDPKELMAWVDRLAALGCNLAVLEGPSLQWQAVPANLRPFLDQLKAKGIYTVFLGEEKLLPAGVLDDGAVLPKTILNWVSADWNGVRETGPGPVTFEDSPMVLAPEKSLLVQALAQRTWGTPFGLLWSGGWPNEYLSEMPLVVATNAFFQGLPAVAGMEFSPADGAQGLQWGDGLDDKPFLTSQWPVASLAYLRGDLKEGRMQVAGKETDPLRLLVHPSGLQPEDGKFKNDPSGVLKGKVQDKTRSLVTDTEQIHWQGNVGLYEVSSTRLQVVAGFLAHRKLKSPVWQVESENRYAVFSLISLNKTNLWASTHMLLTAATRMENSGQVYNALKTKLMEKGRAPILLEPARAKITLFRYQKDPALKVRALGWDGQPLNIHVPVKWAKTNLTIQWPSTAYFVEVFKP